MYIGTSLDLHSPTKHPHGPTKDTINPAYHIITDDQFKKSAEEPISYYEEVNKSAELNMTPNPAYAVP